MKMTIVKLSYGDEIFFEKEFNHKLNKEERESVKRVLTKRFPEWNIDDPDFVRFDFSETSLRCPDTRELFKTGLVS